MIQQYTIDILQTDKVIVMIFATLVAGAFIDDCLKRKLSWVNYFLNNHGK